jgi:hypothetical protein
MNQIQAHNYFFEGDINSTEEKKKRKNRAPKRYYVPMVKQFEEKEETYENIMEFGKRIRKSILNNHLELLSVTSNHYKGDSSLSTLSPARSRKSHFFHNESRRQSQGKIQSYNEEELSKLDNKDIPGFLWSEH